MIDPTDSNVTNCTLTLQLRAQAAAYNASDWFDRIDVNIFGTESTSRVWVVIFDCEIRIYEKSCGLKNVLKSQCQVLSCDSIKKITIVLYDEDRYE